MSEANRKGSRQERVAAAIARGKKLLVRGIRGECDDDMKTLRMGLQLFMDRLTDQQWAKRRQAVLVDLKKVIRDEKLSNSESILVQNDVMGWYLFLCHQTIYDPLCVQDSQAQRILPFFDALGRRMSYKSKIKGLDKKVEEMLNLYHKDPDGIFFELLVAFSYAEAGWDCSGIVNLAT